MVQGNSDDTQIVDHEHAEVWQRWIDKREPGVRNELVQLYLPFARTISAKLFSMRSADGLEFDDYMQLATIGLMEAIEKFDPTLNAKFETYASYRVKGAILNGLEKGSEKMAQGVYRKRYMRDRLESIQDGFSKDNDASLFKDMVDAAIGMALGYMLEDSELTGRVEEARDNPYKQLEVRRLAQRLRLIVEHLPEKEAQVVRYHYFEHRNFSEIAEMMQLTKGRVSQLHSRALQIIRDQYEETSGFNVSY